MHSLKAACAGLGLATVLAGGGGALAHPSALALSESPTAAVPHAAPPLQHFFLSGIACLVRGDPAGAAQVFAVTDRVATRLPQMHYLLALARVLADFDRRSEALPLIAEALRQDPEHPLYAILEVFADPKLSLLRSDGALYLTPAGAGRLRAAAERLPAAKDAYNGKYFSLLTSALEPTGDAALPLRWKGFKLMLGPGRAIALPGIREPQALGRLLVLAAPELSAYEMRFVAGAGTDRRSELAPGVAP